MTTLDELKDKYLGEIGTPMRDEYEKKLKEDLAQKGRVHTFSDIQINMIAADWADKYERNKDQQAGFVAGMTEMRSRFSDMFGNKLTLNDYTMFIIQAELYTNQGDVKATADKLGIGESSVYRYVKEGMIELPPKMIRTYKRKKD